MRFSPLSIPGAYRIYIDRRDDERGFFARTFCADEFRAQGLVFEFPQRSISFNKKKGTLRGLHYQIAPYAETKIVRCVSGEAFDVMVDLRRASPTFGRWHAEIISAESRMMLYIPTGCAHGFQTLADATEIYYEITPAFRPEAARGIAFDDPEIGIDWPFDMPTMSASDRSHPAFSKAVVVS
jgi:dTDP-4-dehydrorhamnose 3,5-epimerase